MSEIAVEDFLEHYGVKGMKWGVRKNDDGPAGVPRKTAKAAKKDAEEFTRAKLFYGEGAGNRRKLINATVAQRSKNDAAYKKAFDHYVERTDLAKRASQARGERKRKDVKAKVGKTIRGTKHILEGNTQYASAVTALLVGGALYVHRQGIDKAIYDSAKKTVNNLQQSAKDRRNMKIAEDLLKSAGFR